MSEIVREDPDRGVTVVAVSGAADSTAGTELRSALDEVLGDPAARLIVDLSRATFLDSAVLGTLAAAYERSGSSDGAAPRMAVVCPEGNVRTMFEITALDSLLPLADTMEGARAVMG